MAQWTPVAMKHPMGDVAVVYWIVKGNSGRARINTYHAVIYRRKQNTIHALVGVGYRRW